MNKLLKNQKGLLAIAAAIIIVGAFMMFGKTDRMSNGAVAVDSEKTDPKGEAAPPRVPQGEPKAPVSSGSVTSAPAPTPAPSAGLNGSTFRLTAYNGTVIPNGDIYTVTFKAGNPTFEDGIIAAKFCNTLTTPYRVKAGVISGDISGTKMYCAEPKDAMKLEGTFQALIDGGSKMTLAGNSLTLTDNIKTMVFIRQ